MLCLQSHEKFRDVGLMRVPGRIERYDRSTVLAEHPELRERLAKWKVDGMFEDVDGHELALYRDGGELFLLWDGKVVPWNSIRSMELERGEEDSSLTVVTESEELRLTYTPVQLDPPLSPILEPFSDYEHYDFCLYLKNVYESSYRTSGIFRWDRI